MRQVFWVFLGSVLRCMCHTKRYQCVAHCPEKAATIYDSDAMVPGLSPSLSRYKQKFYLKLLKGRNFPSNLVAPWIGNLINLYPVRMCKLQWLCVQRMVLNDTDNGTYEIVVNMTKHLFGWHRVWFFETVLSRGRSWAAKNTIMYETEIIVKRERNLRSLCAQAIIIAECSSPLPKFPKTRMTTI